MAIRSERFTDIDFRTSPRSYNQPHPLAYKAVPSDFGEIQRTLTWELNHSQLYLTVWRSAKAEYVQKRLYLSADHFSSSIPEECYIAVIAYTLDEEVYVNGQHRKLFREFNKKFRQLTEADAWASFPFKSFYYLLVIARPWIKNNPDPNGRLFRGIRGFRFNVAPRKGEDFYFDHLASSSSDKHVAEVFTGSFGTIIEIRNGAEEAMGITDYSYYPNEKEVLILPGNKFKVVSFKIGYRVDELVLEREKSAMGTVVMGVIGGALGSVAGPVGTVMGAAAGMALRKMFS